MNKKIVASVSSLGSVAAALVASQAFGSNQWVTIVGLSGLAITALLTHNTAEQVNRDLHNGTFEKLLREAIQKLAEEEKTPIEIHSEATPPDETRGEETP